MPEKTVSQKIARAFEIVDYILLVPSIGGLLLGLVMLGGGGGGNGRSEGLMVALAIIAAFTIGVTLLVGYFKHSRGTLSAGGTRALWIGTIFFNGLFLAPSLYFLFNGTTENDINEIISSPLGWLMIWWTTAISGAIIALGDSKDKTKIS